MRVRSFIAWLLIGLGIASLLLLVGGVIFAGAGDPKSSGSLVFAGFFLVATGWVIGEF